MREASEPPAYDHAMGLFRKVMGLFGSRAGDNREEAAARFADEQSRTVKAERVVVPREVKREARPDPDKPGWGQTISL
jgi:hypothetical protein